MKPMDGQDIAAGVIVAGAVLYVGNRLLGQILAFRTPKSGNSGEVGCSGCSANKTAQAKPSASLVQIQTRPPVRLQRPPAEK